RGLKEDRRAAHVDVGVEGGLLDGGSDAGARGEVDDDVGAFAFEERVDRVFVADVALDEGERAGAGGTRDVVEVGSLEGLWIEGVEVVEPDDAVAAREEG